MSEKDLSRMGKISVKSIKKYFVDVGGDFENPTKESIVLVIGKLKNFAKNFRNPKIIAKHAGEIMILANKLGDKK